MAWLNSNQLKGILLPDQQEEVIWYPYQLVVKDTL